MTVATLALEDARLVTQAGEAVAKLKQLLRSSQREETLSFEAGTREERVEIRLPSAAVELMADLLAELAAGRRVTIAPTATELTTQQAADLLDVSRPYLVKLLDEGAIPHRRVGNRRKVRLDDLYAYKRRDDDRRKKILDELAVEAQEMGLGY